MSKSKPYEHTSGIGSFKHNTIHLSNVSDLVKSMRKKAKALKYPADMPLSQLAKIALTDWVNSKSAS